MQLCTSSERPYLTYCYIRIIRWLRSLSWPKLLTIYKCTHSPTVGQWYAYILEWDNRAAFRIFRIAYLFPCPPRIGAARAAPLRISWSFAADGGSPAAPAFCQGAHCGGRAKGQEDQRGRLPAAVQRRQRRQRGNFSIWVSRPLAHLSPLRGAGWPSCSPPVRLVLTAKR